MATQSGQVGENAGQKNVVGSESIKFSQYSRNFGIRGFRLHQNEMGLRIYLMSDERLKSSHSNSLMS